MTNFVLILRFFVFIYFLTATAFAANESLPLIDPQQDPDVIPHLERGYYELKDQSPRISELTKDQSKKIVADFLKFSAVFLKKENRELQINLDWENPYYAASAQLLKNKIQITLWGGYLRAPGNNKSILALTLCHELGHLVGGYPKQTVDVEENASAEAVSDFFAAKDCLDLFYQSHPEYAPAEVPSDVQSFCQGDKACELTVESGRQTFLYLQKWSYVPYTPVQIFAPTETVTEFSPNTYPSFQCRLETVKVGARCAAQENRSSCQPPPCWWPEGWPYPPPPEFSQKPR